MTSPFLKPQPQEWIRAYAQVQVVADQEVFAILADAQQSLRVEIARIAAKVDPTISDGIRYQQLSMMRQAIMEEQSAVLRGVGKVVEARRLDAASRAIRIGNGMDAYLLERLGQGTLAREALTGLQFGLARTTEVAMARMGLSYTELAQRIYNNDVALGSRIDARISSLLAQGKTAREFAAEAADWFDPNTPGGVQYAAMRLARSEINNAFHAVSVQQVQDKPWVHAMQWHLSGSHPKADTCDEYANDDKFELGAGIWPKAEVPRKPHPHCYCYVSPVQNSEDEFLDALVSGKYDHWVEQERRLQSGPAPKMPSTIRPKLAAGEPNPVVQSLKRSLGDFERNPRLLTGMSPAQVKQVARAYRLDPGGSAESVAQRVAQHLRGGAARPTAPVAKEAAKVVRAVERQATKVATREVPRPSVITERPRISATNAAKQQRMEAAVARQEALAPRSLARLRSASEMTADERRLFAERFGSDAIGGYIEDEQRIVFHPSTFTEKATASLRREVASGYSSAIGADVSGLDGTFAHEFGHHLYHMASIRGPQAVKPLWDTLAAETGVPRPLFYDSASLDKWVAKHKETLGRAVSRYGATDSEEIMGEIWAEYSTNPQARPAIRSVGELLRTIAEDSA